MDHKRTGRKPLPSRKKLARIIGVRFNEEALDRIEDAARATDRPLAAFIRWAALVAAGVVPESPERRGEANRDR